MSWRTRARGRDNGAEHDVVMDAFEGDAWEYLLDEGDLDGARLDRRCNELGMQGWELVAVVPLSRPALSSGGRTTAVQLFFKRRLL